MQTCTECGHKMLKETKLDSWFALINFIEFLQSEEYINIETAENMRNRLMDFKKYAMDEVYGKE